MCNVNINIWRNKGKANNPSMIPNSEKSLGSLLQRTTWEPGCWRNNRGPLNMSQSCSRCSWAGTSMRNHRRWSESAAKGLCRLFTQRELSVRVRALVYVYVQGVPFILCWILRTETSFLTTLYLDLQNVEMPIISKYLKYNDWASERRVINKNMELITQK